MHNIVIEDHQIPGSERRSFLFNAFDSLEEGDSIIIKSEYDPRYLWSQFSESRPTQFTLEYLNEGPNEWKVKLTKTPHQDWNLMQ